MEYGAIPKLDQFTDNRALNIQKVQSSKESSGITNKEDLKETLQALISDKNLRQSYADNALRTTKENHTADFNADKFKSLLEDVVKKVSENK